MCADRTLGRQADKRLGQHFLHDPRVLERIAATLPGVTKCPDLLEIGPGTGALTKLLVEAGYRVQVVEKDPRWQALMTELGAETGWPKVVFDDALAADWRVLLAVDDAAVAHERPRVAQNRGVMPVIGNRPYNVGTEIVADLVRLAETGEAPPVMVFMLQKEVVDRICAKPGTGKQDGADWGRLGVLCDLLCEREALFDVGPGAFSPPPKVMSSVVRLTPLPQARYPVDLGKLDRVLRQAFGQRRKMLRASLKGLLTEAQIAAAGVDPAARPEVLPTEGFCRLANSL